MPVAVWLQRGQQGVDEDPPRTLRVRYWMVRAVELDEAGACFQ